MEEGYSVEWEQRHNEMKQEEAQRIIEEKTKGRKGYIKITFVTPLEEEGRTRDENSGYTGAEINNVSLHELYRTITAMDVLKKELIKTYKLSKIELLRYKINETHKYM